MALKLRSDRWRSTRVTGASGGHAVGSLAKIQDTVFTFPVALAEGATGAGIYQADKVVLPKKTGEAMAVGAKVYFEAASGKLTGTSTSNTLCGRCTVAAVSADTEVEVDFDGAAS